MELMTVVFSNLYSTWLEQGSEVNILCRVTVQVFYSRYSRWFIYHILY